MTLKRSKPLRADPAKTREFIDRNRKPLKRTPPKPKARIPKATRDAVYRRSGGWCIVCGRARAEECHHVLSQFRFEQHAHEPDNLVGVCRGCHDLHERAHRRIRWSELPEVVQRFVLAVAVDDPRAASYAVRCYPR
jgi:5-methylcytosine-specific restriction endonuclease McrA